MAGQSTKAVGPGGATRVRFDVDQCRHLVAGYRRVEASLQELDADVSSLLRRADGLLEFATPKPDLWAIGQELAADALDLERRLDFIEIADRLDLPAPDVAKRFGSLAGSELSARHYSWQQLAAVVAPARGRELKVVVEWLERTGGFDRGELRGTRSHIPVEYRSLIATALVIAYEDGWRPTTGDMPRWLAAGMAVYGQPSDEALLDFANDTLGDGGPQDRAASANPFGVAGEVPFGVVAQELMERPGLPRSFIASLLDEFDRTGQTRLNQHARNSPTTTHLAGLVRAGSAGGELGERTQFVDRMITTINADGATSNEVFWKVWEAHGRLALDHDVVTTEPTFSDHRLIPEGWRASWEEAWNDQVSPTVLFHATDMANEGVSAAKLAWQLSTPGLLNRLRSDDDERQMAGNDAGGTYSIREKADFSGTRFHFSKADAGRNVITHALRDGSSDGDIAQDEFAIIDHGVGADGKRSYTINLPGVIDLSSPMPGWDPTHASARDFDMASLPSASSARVEDNVYAQMVETALERIGVPVGSKLMLIGHSFGADTAGDLAASTSFTRDFKVTHVVAAAYDSVPQLAHIDPAIDVLVIQNRDDAAILMESSQRKASMAKESVSVNTFAHEVREFDGGFGADVGHHQDRYIDYLDDANDLVITKFYESIGDAGYARPGTSVAVDVTIDESLFG